MKKSKFKIISVLVLFAVVFITALSACSLEDLIDNYSGDIGEIEKTSSQSISVHCLDVGQGDAIFVELPDYKCMLIDAGVSGKGDYIKSYITARGYDKVDYLVATHPHADHIGSMDYIVNNMDIGQIYMPNVATTTKTYERLLEAVRDKGLKIKSAKAGMKIIDDDNLCVCIIAPAKIDEDNLNNCSVIIKITYLKDSYLLTGDAEKEELSAVTADMSADVLKVGHHGSRTSSTEEFFEEVNPKYALISCGTDNDYGHPHKETVKLLKQFNVEYYRTYIQGTITITSDGERNYRVITEK